MSLCSIRFLVLECSHQGVTCIVVQILYGFLSIYCRRSFTLAEKSMVKEYILATQVKSLIKDSTGEGGTSLLSAPLHDNEACLEA